MNAIIDTAVGRARTVISVLIAGSVSYVTIPKESNPDIDVPIIYVVMTLEGISPEDAERLLVRPMEQELRSIEGIKEITSEARQGSASVTMEFEAGFDSDQAMVDVREKIDLVKPDLPSETDEPTAHEVNLGLFPIITVTLSGDLPERTLLKIGRDLQDKLEALSGVLNANIAGDREEVLEVIVDPSRLEAYQVSQEDLVNVVARNNQLVPAGELDTGSGRFGFKVPGLFESAKDVLELPIKVNGDRVVTLADITTVRRTFKDPTSFARVDGRRALTLEISKRLGENIIDTIENVRAVVDRERQFWPPNVEVSYINDQSSDIRTMLADLQNNVLSAILLVMIVVVAALGWRTAGLVGLAIPASFLFGILVLNAMDFTVNIVVLFSLILAVGMLVDGAIVVTEYADRKMSEGLHKREAYALAAKRMAWPITASTATTLAAFMPLVFWPGIVGEFMKYLPITLIVTLTGSLLMALIFVPTLGGLFGKAGSSDSATLKGLSAAESGDLAHLSGITGFYARLLDRLVRNRFALAATILLAFGSLIGVWMAYGQFGRGVEFFPEVEPEQALVYIHDRGNRSTVEKDRLVRQVEAEVMKVAGIDTVYARTGKAEGGGGGGGGGEVSEDTIGTIFLELSDWSERRPVNAILQEIRDRTEPLYGIHVEARIPDAGPPTGKDVQIQLRSRDAERIAPMVELVREKFDNTPGLIDIEDSRPLPGIEMQIKVDRAQASRFGADVLTVGNAVQMGINGVKIGSYRPDDADEEIDIRARFPQEERAMSVLSRLRVQTPNGNVPVSNFVTETPRQKTGTLKRIDGQRVITIQANVADGILVDDMVTDMKAWMAEMQAAGKLDPAVEFTFRGADEDQKESQDFLMKAFGVALFIMAIILITQFNSFFHALLILTAVIMSTVGVTLGLLITDQVFGIVMTGIGIIALAGIVVNNNIVLIDTYARLKREGMEPLEAVVRTGAQRLRPVMLTTITTICGLMPMVFQANIDFFARTVSVGAPSTQWWVQLATAVAFGLGFATILTLVVTPSLLAVGARTSAMLTARRERREARREARLAEAAVEAAE